MKFEQRGMFWLPVEENKPRDVWAAIAADIEDALLYGPKTMARIRERRRIYCAKRRKAKRHARYRRGKTGVRPRKRDR